MNVQLTYEAQQSLEGYLQVKTMLVEETEADWVFQTEYLKQYRIRKLDGAAYCQGRLVVLLSLNVDETKWSQLILSLLKRYPHGVEYLKDDTHAIYFSIYQKIKKKRFQKTIQYSKATGAIRVLQGDHLKLANVQVG
ncbi:hypothetical protein ABC345_05920 [Shouchella sp. 1P09AA]|uniref:hypothetical protein n=1 Tax=unclassified Shouchella TaxID=2893065 RepID=UPI0039A3F6E4